REASSSLIRRVSSGVCAARRPSWFWDKGMSRPIRRILSWTAIHLGAPSPTRSSGLPAKDRVESLDAVRAGRPRTFAQSRERLLLTLLRVGFTEPPPSPAALVVSYTTVSPLPASHVGEAEPNGPALTGPWNTGGLLSVALSRGSPRVAVGNHPALRSPDVPRQRRHSSLPRPPGRLIPAVKRTLSDAMMLLQVSGLLLAGLVAGGLNAVAGGGSLVTYPTLIAVGVPPLHANATNGIAVAPAYAAASFGSRNDLLKRRALSVVPTALVASVCGTLLLLNTSHAVFEALVPFLVLAATLLMAVGPWVNRKVTALNGGRDLHPVALHAGVGLGCLYGAYFNAALGLVLLAVIGMSLNE